MFPLCFRVISPGLEWTPDGLVLVMNFSVCTFPYVTRKRRAARSVIKLWPAFSGILIMYQRLSQTPPVFFIKVLLAGIWNVIMK